MDFLDQLKPFIDWLHMHPGWAGVVTFLISLAESLAVVGLLVPGSVMMTAIGTLIGAGIVPGWQIIAWAIAGAIAGDSISYRIGYHYNEHLRDMWPFSRYPQILIKGEEFFNKHGGKSVFLARFVGPVRPIIPLVAGMMSLSQSRFLISNVSSAFIWAPFYMVPGMLIGAATLELDPKTATRFILTVLIVLVVISLSAWLFKLLFAFIINFLSRQLDKLWRFLKVHPRCHFICSAFQDPRHPEHHGQLTLAISFFTTLTAFIILAILVQEFGFLSNINEYTHNFMQSLHTTSLNRFFIVITEIGYRINICLMAIAGIAFLAWKKRWRTALHYLAVLGLVFVSVLSLKIFIDSPRPDGLLIPIPTNSFPSGHTTGAVAVYGFLAVLLARDMSSIPRRIIYSLTTLLCILIIFSRLYLGAHWITDIAGGVLLGLTIVMLVTISYRRKDAKRLPFIGLLITSVVAIMLIVFLQLFNKYDDMVKQYTPERPIQAIQMQSWWKDAKVHSPIYRTNRIGKPVQMFNIEWVGSLDNIKQDLIEDGWKQLPKLTFISMINRISAEGDARLLPIIPKLYGGNQPSLVLIKKLNDTEASIVLRLWPSDTRIEGDAKPLWYGTVGYQLPRGYQPWLYKHQKTAMRRLKPAILSIQSALDNFCWKRTAFPAEERPAKIIHRQTWTGGVFLIRPKAETANGCDHF